MTFKKNDVITKQDLDQMQQNSQWLNDNTPRGRFYRASGEALDVRTVMICGRANIKKNVNKDSATVNVNFGKAFSSTCRPHVTTGIVNSGQTRIFCVVHGPGAKNYPNSNGFQISINVDAAQKKNDKIVKGFWIHWQAFGYRGDDMNEF